MICKRGVLCKKGDAFGFAKGLKSLSEMDTPKREELVRHARAFVIQSFSEDRRVKDIEGLYLDLLGR